MTVFRAARRFFWPEPDYTVPDRSYGAQGGCLPPRRARDSPVLLNWRLSSHLIAAPPASFLPQVGTNSFRTLPYLNQNSVLFNSACEALEHALLAVNSVIIVWLSSLILFLNFLLSALWELFTSADGLVKAGMSCGRFEVWTLRLFREYDEPSSTCMSYERFQVFEYPATGAKAVFKHWDTSLSCPDSKRAQFPYILTFSACNFACPARLSVPHPS